MGKHQIDGLHFILMYNNINSPPSFVNVMNVNSPTEEPAMLCASILSW
jgi:hypothetical protein